MLSFYPLHFIDIKILHKAMGVGRSTGSKVAGTGSVESDPQVAHMGLLDPPRPILYMPFLCYDRKLLGRPNFVI